MFFNMRGLVAEYEREKIRERTARACPISRGRP